MNEKYIPVSSRFYDELDRLVKSGKPCEIIYLKQGVRLVVRSIIVDLFSGQEGDFIITDSGLEIRLDQLVQVDNKLAPNYC